MTSMLTHAVEQIDRAFIDDVPVIQSGIPSLDLETGGLAAGEVVLILSPERRAGTEMLLHTVLRKLKPIPGPIDQLENTSVPRTHVTLWSLCESVVGIGMRFIAMQSGLPYGRLRRGKVNDEDWPELIQAVGMLNEREDFLLIDRTVSQPEAKRLIAHHHTQEHCTQRILFVDSAEAALGACSLKETVQLVDDVAMEVNVPVVILHRMMEPLWAPWCESKTMATIHQHCRYVGVLDASSTDDIDEFPEIRWVR